MGITERCDGMRLINAEELKEWIARVYPARAARGFCGLVDEMNTAYDVEKAIGQLKEEGFISEGAAGDRIEGIIRGGGGK